MPRLGPEHAWLRDEGRVEYTYCTDGEALKAFRFLSETEGIIPALESAHAVAEAIKLAPTLRPDQTIIITCLSARGDKDVQQVLRADVGVVDIKGARWTSPDLKLPWPCQLSPKYAVFGSRSNAKKGIRPPSSA